MTSKFYGYGKAIHVEGTSDPKKYTYEPPKGWKLAGKRVMLNVQPLDGGGDNVLRSGIIRDVGDLCSDRFKIGSWAWVTPRGNIVMNMSHTDDIAEGDIGNTWWVIDESDIIFYKEAD